jgi:hypothetical protein
MIPLIPILLYVTASQCTAGYVYNASTGICQLATPQIIPISDYEVGGIVVVLLALVYAMGENFGLWDKYFRRVDLKTAQGLEAALPSAELPVTISIGTEKWHTDRWLANKQSTDYLLVWDVKMHNMFGAVRDGEIINEKQLRFDFKAWKTWGNSFGIPFIYDAKGGSSDLEKENMELRRINEQKDVDIARLVDENMRLKQSPEAQANFDVATAAATDQSGGLYGGTRKSLFDTGMRGGDDYTDEDDESLEVD